MAKEPEKFTFPSSSFQKVVAGNEPGTFNTPPPASSDPPPERPPGMPLPPGKIIQPQSLTEMERKQLEALGWKDGQAVPGDLPEQLEQVRKEAQADIDNPPPPVHPSVEPLKVPEAVPIDNLPPEKQAELRAALQQAEQQAQAPTPPPLPPDMSQSVAAAASGAVDRQIDITDDRKAPEQPHRSPQGPSSSADTPEEFGCPHCGWDTRQKDIVEITEGDRNTFFQATLGGVPWQKRYELFGGELVLVFRQLTTREIDSIYQDTYAMQKDGSIEKPEDTWEHINRFRICLQLVAALSETGVNFTFPRSLEEWGCRPREVAQAMYDKVLATESMSRIVSRQATLFNRTVVKLEDQVDAPDFWTGIATPS